LTKPEGVDQRDDAVNQSIRDDERHQDDSVAPGCNNVSTPNANAAMPRNRKQPPVMA